MLFYSLYFRSATEWSSRLQEPRTFSSDSGTARSLLVRRFALSRGFVYKPIFSNHFYDRNSLYSSCLTQEPNKRTCKLSYRTGRDDRLQECSCSSMRYMSTLTSDQKCGASPWLSERISTEFAFRFFLRLFNTIYSLPWRSLFPACSAMANFTF